MTALQDVDPHEVQDLEDMRRALIRTQRQLRLAKQKTAELREATIDACRDAVLARGPLPVVPKPKLVSTGSKPEIALAHMTDWQGAKVTTSYNTEVMRVRVRKFTEKVEELTAIQRAHHPVKDAVLLLGGDMIEGLFNYPTQPYEIDAGLFEQFVNVSSLLVETARRFLAHFDKVTVVAEWGNHGRIGDRRAVVARHDNADRMTYELARQLLASEKRLTWHDCPEDIQRVEVGNYRALLIHGDEIGRGGFASPMTIVRHADRWASGSYPWDFQDLYVGHYHTHNEWAMANGAGTVYQTGSTESDNRYARETMAASATPSQRLHFIDPRKGRVTAQYKVHLD